MNDAELKARTVRLSRRIDAAVAEAARGEGITASQFIREAILARLVWREAIGNPKLVSELEKCLRDIRDGTI